MSEQKTHTQKKERKIYTSSKRGEPWTKEKRAEYMKNYRRAMRGETKNEKLLRFEQMLETMKTMFQTISF